MSTNKRQVTAAQSLSNQDYLKAVERAARVGAKSVDGLSAAEREDAERDALLACVEQQPADAEAYAYKVARNSALGRQAALERESQLSKGNIQPFRSGQSRKPSEPSALDEEALRRLESLRRRLVLYLVELLDDRGRVRTEGALASVRRQIAESFPGRSAGAEPRGRGGRPARPLPPDPANAALVERINARRRRRDAASRLVDRELRRFGFRAQDLKAATRGAAFAAVVPAKWKRRFERAIEQDRAGYVEKERLLNGESLAGRSAAFRARRRPKTT